MKEFIMKMKEETKNRKKKLGNDCVRPLRFHNIHESTRRFRLFKKKNDVSELYAR